MFPFTASYNYTFYRKLSDNEKSIALTAIKDYFSTQASLDFQTKTLHDFSFKGGIFGKEKPDKLTGITRQIFTIHDENNKTIIMCNFEMTKLGFILPIPMVFLGVSLFKNILAGIFPFLWLGCLPLFILRKRQKKMFFTITPVINDYMKKIEIVE